MDDDRLRTLVRVVPVLVLGGGVLWFYASSDMDSRLSSLRSEIRQQGYTRQGGLPTADEVRVRAEALAQERSIALSDVSVALDANGAPDAQGRAAASALGPLQLTMRYTGYAVTGRARVSKWFFSREEPLDVHFSLRREVSTPSMPGMREPTPQELRGDDPVQQRGM